MTSYALNQNLYKREFKWVVNTNLGSIASTKSEDNISMLDLSLA